MLGGRKREYIAKIVNVASIMELPKFENVVSKKNGGSMC